MNGRQNPPDSPGAGITLSGKPQVTSASPMPAPVLMPNCVLERCELLQNLNSIILLLDADHTILFINRFGLSFFGFEAGELIGHNVIGTIVPAADSAGRDLAAMIADIGVHPELYVGNENENMCRDGRRVWVSWSNRAVRDDAGALRHILCVGNDATARKTSELNYKTLLDNVPQRIYFKDINSVYLSCNNHYADDLGISPDDITGRTDYDLFPEYLAQKYRADDKRIIQSNSIENIEEHYPLHGTIITINTIKTPVRNDHGAVIGILGVFWDITEKKQIEREKRTIEQALEKNAAFLSIKNEISSLLLSSRELNEILHMILIGVTANRALGFNRAFLFLLNEETQQLEGRVATGPLTHDEAHSTWARLSRQDHSMSELFYLRKAEMALGDEPIQLLVRQMKIPLSDPDSLFSQLVNRQKSFNISGGILPLRNDYPDFIEHLGTDAFALVPLTARGSTLGMLVADNLITGKPISDRDVQVLHDFANLASLAIANSRLYEQQRASFEELHRTNRELAESQEKLVRYERLSAIGAVAAQVAHDIRNPLTAIGGFARRLLRQSDTTPPNQDYFKIIVQEVDRMEHILSDLLSFSKPPDIVRTPGDINEVLRSTVTVYMQEIEKRAIAYCENLAADMPEIELDSAHMQRVFDNIVKNALDAMQDGEAGSRLTITSGQDGTMAYVTIADTGAGIGDNVADKIFDPFYTSKASGSGLGLTLAAQVVTAHGGTITWQPAEPRGTCFIIALPLQNS
ncbi:MAG: PAS domain S-box protein [Deltaproteobacteria bacterium]|nr:PAS domain S-box protein [Deltaproteobacteria bacterium]